MARLNLTEQALKQEAQSQLAAYNKDYKTVKGDLIS